MMSLFLFFFFFFCTSIYPDVPVGFFLSFFPFDTSSIGFVLRSPLPCLFSSRRREGYFSSYVIYFSVTPCSRPVDFFAPLSSPLVLHVYRPPRTIPYPLEKSLLADPSFKAYAPIASPLALSLYFWVPPVEECPYLA